MRRTTIVASAVASIGLLTGGASAAAANFAGKWVAQYNKATTLMLTIQPSGAKYTGTYSFSTTIPTKQGKKTATVSQPLTAVAVVMKKVPTLIVDLTRTKERPAATFYCQLTKPSSLSCQSRVTGKSIVFSPSK